MIGESTIRTRLCPQCANSIQEDATNCPYCKADLLLHFVPKWLKRDGPMSEPRFGVSRTSKNRKSSILSQYIWIAGMVAVALIAFFAGGYMKGSQLLSSSQTNLKELQAKTQMIQSQEAQLAKTRQELDQNSGQLVETKTKLEQSQKELSLTQQRLAVATRELDRLKATRSAATTRTRSRAPDAAVSFPTSAAARRTAEPGVYETTRATAVYEDPSSTSRVLSQINRGTRINVVSSAGDWLQVRSKRGNPPGYVRADDARLMGAVN